MLKRSLYRPLDIESWWANDTTEMFCFMKGRKGKAKRKVWI